MRATKQHRTCDVCFRPAWSPAAVLALSLILNVTITSAQSQFVSPGENLEAVGVPAIPASLARVVQRHTTGYGLPLTEWDPAKREIWLKNLTSDSASVFRVTEPGAASQPFLYIPAGVYDLYYQPQGHYLVYNQDSKGNEAFQMYLYDLGTHKSLLLTDGKSRNTEPVWSNAGDRIIYSA